jgi:hypothetical protein
LYEYVLACTNPNDCEQDVQLLESIGATMARTSALRTDFLPFARTINALNKVSRSIQDERRKAANLAATTGEVIPDFDFSAFASFPDFPFNFEDSSQPFGFVRALENDVIARNWNEGWWDIGTSIDDPLSGVPER